MIITDKKSLKAVQSEFNQKFPYLKLEFYSKKHGEGEGSPKEQLLPSNKTIGEVRTIHSEGDLSINGHLKVSTLEQNFSKQYGLNVQVFRKSGEIWLQTAATDDWTLTAQNERAESFIKNQLT